MKLHKFTKLNIENIQNINMPFNINVEELNKLKLKSIPIIYDILKNFSYKLVENIKLKSVFYNNIYINVIKSSNINYNNKYYKFINNVKNNKYTKSEIFDYINFNTDITNHFDFSILDSKLSAYPKSILSKFVPPEIFNDILKNLLHKQEYIIKYKNNILKFYIYSDGTFSNFYKTILFIKGLYLLEIYNLNNINLTIHIFLSDIKKKIKSHGYLGPREINSGLTSFSPFLNPEICIFRKEEVDKLLLHELTHATFKDGNLNGIDTIESKIKCSFNINKNNKINFFEAYTESMALICNSVCNSIFSNISISEIFINEIKFSIFQCSKILQFYNINDIDKFFCTKCCFTGNSKHIEKTSVLSYYFLKLGLIFNSNLFMNKYFYSNKISSKKLLIDIKNNFINFKHLFLKKKIHDKSLRMTLYTFIWNV